MDNRMTGRTGGSAVGSVSILMLSPRSGGRPSGSSGGNRSGNSTFTIWRMGSGMSVGVGELGLGSLT